MPQTPQQPRQRVSGITVVGDGNNIAVGPGAETAEVNGQTFDLPADGTVVVGNNTITTQSS